MFCDYFGETISLEPPKKNKQTEPVRGFNMMETASGVKGMFILATTGALEWYWSEIFLSHTVVTTTVAPLQKSL